VLQNTPDNMARWIMRPQHVRPITAMPDVRVREEDARDIAAYLETLRSD
jgi:cytochrome c1